MDLTKSPLPFRAIAIFVAIFLAALAMLLLSDRIAWLGELFNAHSAIGGVSLLALIVVGALCSVGLIFVLPWAAAVFCRSDSSRTFANAFLLMTGTLSLGLLGWWLLQVARH